MATLGEKTVFPSIKIPLEHLLTGLMFLSSGRDKSGRLLLSINCALCDGSEAEVLRTLNQSDLTDMLTYFISMPSAATRAMGFVVIVKGADLGKGFIDLILQAMVEVQKSHPGVFNKIYIIQPEATSTEHFGQQYKLPLCLVKDLAAYVSDDNLTAEFGGTREYKHIEWLKYRMQVEPFVSDCCSLSKKLAEVVGTLTNPELPNNYMSAKSATQIHKDQKTSLMDDLHIDQLVKEGNKLQDRMKTPTESLKDNTDFIESTSLVGRLLSQIVSVSERLSQLWHTKDTKLQTNLELREYEYKCQQVSDWFKNYSEEYFVTNDDLGDAKESSVSLLKELDDFQASSKEVVSKAETLITEAPRLRGLDHIDGDSVQSISDQLHQHVVQFEAALATRRKALEDAIRIHTLTEKAITWCLKAAEVIKKSTSLEEFEQKLTELETFMTSDSSLTAEQETELHELSDKTKSVWIRENAIFALTRISETVEKVSVYKEYLENGIAECKLKSKKIDPSNDNCPSSEDSVDSGQVVAATRRTPDVYEEGVGLSVCEDPIDCFSEVEAVIEKSQELLEAQIPAAPVLQPDRQETGKKRAYTFPPPDDGTKQTRIGDSFDGGLFSRFVARSDETDIPEGGDESMQSQTDMAKKRRQIMSELVETEGEYVKKLGHICENYIGEVEMLEGLPGGLVGKKNILFSNIEMLFGFNKNMFLPELQRIRQSPMKLGQIFVDNEGFLFSYSWYFKNMPAQKKLMKEFGAEYFAPVQKRFSDPFPLLENLLLPFQRMTRYCLFLERMIKYSNPTTRGYDELKEAYKITNFILHHGDNMLAVENLSGFNGSLVEQGLLQHQGDLTVIEGRFTSSKRRVFLFENIIIIAKKNKTSKGGIESFTYKESYKTNELGLRETISGHPTRFELWSRKKQTILLQADSIEEKAEWTDAIHDLFMEQMKRLKDQQEIYQRPTSTGFSRGRSMSVRRRTNKQNARLSGDLTALPLPSFAARPYSGLSNISASSEDRSHASSQHISGPIAMERDSRYSATSSSHYELIEPLPHAATNH